MVNHGVTNPADRQTNSEAATCSAQSSTASYTHVYLAALSDCSCADTQQKKTESYYWDYQDPENKTGEQPEKT